jgi:L-aminopeptidase/D-esterase-like protein
VIQPHEGDIGSDPVFAGYHQLNGNGEMTGIAWIEEAGLLTTPIAITNTHSVGVVRDALIAYEVARRPDPLEVHWSLPVVAETYDGWLNDINGFHVKPEHVFQALDAAASGPVAEGCVGGGTGMNCHEFKGGIGTSSRRLGEMEGGFTLGVLVQCNYGLRHQLRIAGVPVGREIPGESVWGDDDGSIIIVLATDAPLLPHQLKRLARRASLGLGRAGSTSSNGSGDLFIAFSTANPESAGTRAPAAITSLPNDRMNPLFLAAVQATEEAIVNALVAAETMTGADGRTVPALPHDPLRELLRRYNRQGPHAAGPDSEETTR